MRPPLKRHLIVATVRLVGWWRGASGWAFHQLKGGAIPLFSSGIQAFESLSTARRPCLGVNEGAQTGSPKPQGAHPDILAHRQVGPWSPRR